MHQLLELFNARLRYDARKDEVIQKLTEQLNVLSRESRQAEKGPLLHDVILLTDSIARFRAKLMSKEHWDMTDLSGPFEVVVAEATEVLERQDVVEWIPTGDRQVDRKFQRALSTVATSDPSADGEVVEVIRRGYVLNGGLFRPQEVSVAKHEPGREGGGQ
jgi:molecular chaperone GrpE (heat shock protein)